jgi:hypothetical protein
MRPFDTKFQADLLTLIADLLILGENTLIVAKEHVFGCEGVTSVGRYPTKKYVGQHVRGGLGRWACRR